MVAYGVTDSHILDDQGGSVINVREDGKSPTLRAQMGGHPPVVMVPSANNAGGSQRMPDKDNFNCVIEGDPPRYIVRRLTPTECARLQGFADRHGWIEEKKALTEEEYKFWLEVRNTHARINGKKVQDYTRPQMLTWYNKLHTDSAEYKMWGNGIALPPALYCMQGIVEAMDREEDDSWLM
jgi:DNA (cytosine-5)-methyltransferase 1